MAMGEQLLNDIEKIGVAVIALKVEGALIDFECSSCISKNKQIARNCECRLQDKTVYSHELTGELTACPLRFITPQLDEAMDRMQYYLKFQGTAPPYEKVNPRFWNFVKYLDYYRMKIKLSEMQEKSSHKDEFHSIVNRYKARSKK